MTEVADLRRFCVHSVAESAQRAQLVEAASFEAAALCFVEEQHPVADEDDEVSLFVEDLETGLRQCFRVDLGSGETAPCDEGCQGPRRGGRHLSSPSSSMEEGRDGGVRRGDEARIKVGVDLRLFPYEDRCGFLMASS
jgi:hypothetical protein